MAIKRSKDAKFQLHLWSRLLEGRIALHGLITASRELEKIKPRNEKTCGTPNYDESTIKSVSKLLSCLVRLRDSYRVKSQFCLAGETYSADSEQYSNIDDELLTNKHDSYNDIRNGTIDKWYEKTKIGTMPKKGYTALELPTLQLITNSLRDKERLIRRTQIDRTNPLNESVDPETFNDDDFYHILLKEMVSKDEGRKWVELQRLKYKAKRKADTRATKGRKIKKDLITKLVNFMAPSKPVNAPNSTINSEQIRNELLKSLFGGSVRRTSENRLS